MIPDSLELKRVHGQTMEFTDEEVKNEQANFSTKQLKT